jgi:hypothetical protein
MPIWGLSRVALEICQYSFTNWQRLWRLRTLNHWNWLYYHFMGWWNRWCFLRYRNSGGFQYRLLRYGLLPNCWLRPWCWWCHAIDRSSWYWSFLRTCMRCFHTLRLRFCCRCSCFRHLNVNVLSQLIRTSKTPSAVTPLSADRIRFYYNLFSYISVKMFEVSYYTKTKIL